MKTIQQVVNKSKYNGDAHNFLLYGGYGSLEWYLKDGWLLKHIHIQGEADSVFAVFEKQVEIIELYKYKDLEKRKDKAYLLLEEIAYHFDAQKVDGYISRAKECLLEG